MRLVEGVLSKGVNVCFHVKWRGQLRCGGRRREGSEYTLSQERKDVNEIVGKVDMEMEDQMFKFNYLSGLSLR